MSTKSDRAERLERLILMARIGEFLRNAGKASNRRRTRPRRLEHLDAKSSQRALLRRKAELLCGPPQPCAVGRAAELERELTGAEEAQRPRPSIDGELRRPFERRQRDVAAAAKPCSLAGGVQVLRDLLVRPRSCNGGPMPDGTVGLVLEGLGECRMRS